KVMSAKLSVVPTICGGCAVASVVTDKLYPTTGLTDPAAGQVNRGVVDSVDPPSAIGVLSTALFCAATLATVGALKSVSIGPKVALPTALPRPSTPSTWK